jgi:phage terminase large subunit
MRDYKMIVTPESVNLVKELNHYIWSDKKSNVPVDDYNHCLDAARYAFERLSRKRTFVAV